MRSSVSAAERRIIKKAWAATDFPVCSIRLAFQSSVANLVFPSRNAAAKPSAFVRMSALKAANFCAGALHGVGGASPRGGGETVELIAQGGGRLVDYDLDCLAGAAPGHSEEEGDREQTKGVAKAAHHHLLPLKGSAPGQIDPPHGEQ